MPVLILFGTFLITLLAYIDRNNKQKNKPALFLGRIRQTYFFYSPSTP
ncbi:MAG: putative holin-like toxin [Lachnospiraceae bacterium]|nr:putative holin-like toxin [Lachnospiraceae bacterium]